MKRMEKKKNDARTEFARRTSDIPAVFGFRALAQVLCRFKSSDACDTRRSPRCATSLVNETTNSNVLGPRGGRRWRSSWRQRWWQPRRKSGGARGEERTSPPALSSDNNTRERDSGSEETAGRKEKEREAEREARTGP